MHWTVKRAKHLVTVPLPVVYFQFDATVDVASFNVNVRLIAANMRKPRNGALHVAIDVGAQREPPPPEVMVAQAPEEH